MIRGNFKPKVDNEASIEGEITNISVYILFFLKLHCY